MNFKINDMIFMENDIPNFFYIIKHGEVEVSNFCYLKFLLVITIM